MYSKATEEEDNKVVERSQKVGDGILIFVSPRVGILYFFVNKSGKLQSGLFSASVAAFLTVSVQDLRPNSQDTSAFYLGNMYEFLADPNVTRASTPPVAKPPPFSPPSSAIWVNSLWFLSFVVSLICALMAMSVQQWTRRHIVLTQPSRCSPEIRARRRAKFAVLLVISSVLEALPILLHMSVFLFFAGLCVFLFNTNHKVFGSVVWLIALSLYVDLVMVPGLRPHTFLLAWVRSCRLSVKGVSKQSWSLDHQILYWLAKALDEDDDALEKFFEAIPGFFDSNLVKNSDGFPEDFLNRFWKTLNRFMCRTLSSNSPAESVKSRLDIGMNAMNVIYSSCASSIPWDSEIFIKCRNQVPQFAEMDHGQLLAYCTSEHKHTAHYAQCLVAKILASMPERNGRWIQLATSAFGLTDLRDCNDHGNDSVKLSILIYLIHQSHRLCLYDWDALKAFSKLDIRHTLPGLQHDFCTLWNEVVEKARQRGPDAVQVQILREIRHLYIALHRGTDAAPTAFSASTTTFTLTLSQRLRYIWGSSSSEDWRLSTILALPSSYPLCDIASHRRDSAAHPHITDSRAISTSTRPDGLPGASPYSPSNGDSSDPQPAERANISAGLPLLSNSTTTSKIGGTSHNPTATPLTNPVHSDPHTTNASPTGGVSSSAPAPASATHILNMLLTPGDADDASASNPFSPVPSIASFFIPSSPPSCVPILPNAELVDVFGGTTLPHPTGNVALPRQHARGLVNTGNMCFVNAMLQLLVHSPSFWNLFGELGDLKRRRGAGGPETRGGATPLVDATVRFFQEFTLEEKEPPPTQQSSQQAAGGKPWEDEGAKKEHITVDSFEPTYMYDAMKKNRHLKRLMVRPRDQDTLF